MESENLLLLNDEEKLAKDFMLKLILEGSTVECDAGEAANIKFERPSWYDDEKYKRGQKYFRDNKFGIMNSNLFGLLSVLAEPKGLNILISTGRSSTPATARKRYISTIFHMLSWYENDLIPDSKSWKSLLMVRKMHLMASTQAKEKKIGMISQTEVAMTAFGFMGFALTRAHMLGIHYKNREDREAFVFFWAVICAMLGVKDEFNMCKHKLEVVEVICEISRRYIFLQILQMETPEFKQMARAFYEGQAAFLPLLSFDSMMFMNRRTAGLPGYQYKADIKKEFLCKTIFTQEELNSIHSYFKSREGYEYIKEFVIDNNVKLLKIQPPTNNNNNNNEKPIFDPKSDKNVVEFDQLTALHKLLGLQQPSELQVTVISPHADWKSICNDHEFKKLSFRDKILVYLRCEAFEGNYKFFGHFVNAQLTEFILKKMKKYNK